MLFFTYLDSPLGLLEITTDKQFVKAISFVDEIRKPSSSDDFLGSETVRQLNEYFDKKRRKFELPLAPNGTLFQKKIWDLLLQIPFGETRSYAELSTTYGDEKAIRAIAAANGKNPIAIVIPCHRVIGKDGKLVGYAGGLPRKQYLLNLESDQTQLF